MAKETTVTCMCYKQKIRQTDKMICKMVFVIFLTPGLNQEEFLDMEILVYCELP